MSNQISTKSNKKRNQKVLFVIIAVLVIIRLLIVDRIPPYVNADFAHDDAWVVRRANNILEGCWLGAYDQYTLIKGVFAPLLMAWCKIIGITYMHMNTVLYILACVAFARAVEPILKNEKAVLFCFILILFNPVSYAMDTWQRAYRNGLSQWQVLLILASLISIYWLREQSWKKLLPWISLGGITIWAFVNTREDSIWILPFVICSTIVTIVTFCVQKKTFCLRKCLLFLCPIAIFLFGNLTLSLVNYSYYGSMLLNDRTKGNYAKVVNDLYMIEPNKEDVEKYSAEMYKYEYHNLFTSTMQKAYSASPTLATAREQINQAIIRWDTNEQNVDGEPFLEMILWALRDGVAEAGHYQSLSETEDFYGEVHDELKSALDEGRLSKRNALSISAGTAPVKSEDIIPTIQEIWASILYSVSFRDVSTNPVKARGNIQQIALFESITGDRAISQGTYTIENGSILHLSGWVFYKPQREVVNVSLRTQLGETIASAEHFESMDVYEYFAENEMQYESAARARFDLAIHENSLGTIEDLTVCFQTEDGKVLAERKLTDVSIGEGVSNEEFAYHIDDVSSLVSLADYEISTYEKEAGKTAFVSGIYKIVGLPLALISICSYIINTVFLIRRRKTGDKSLQAVWLLETGILLSYILFTAIIAYQTTTTFNARLYLYLAPNYLLQLVFYGISISSALILTNKKTKSEC